ncbi:MAG: sugar phosphate isomerase/epimerase [Lachnospiraceae bacterium]|nr:sugar phosphate isomerase/epimerase [Lachnospiraceae bacterium]
MNIICAPAGIVGRENPRQGVTDISAAGFRDMLLDMSLYCTPAKLEKGEKESLEGNQELAALLNHCSKNNICTHVAYAPYLMRHTKHNNTSMIMTQVSEMGIKTAAQSGCQYIVIRPLFAGIPDKDLWKANHEYYLRLADTAKENDMMILLENQCKNKNGHLLRGACSDAVSAAEWVDQLNREVGGERFGFCMDAGVCSICGQNMYDFIHALGDRLKTVILRDCDGSHESALLPFTCANQGRPQTDWLNLIRGLREIFFDGQLILNIKDTATSFPPVLRSGLLAMVKSVADYFEWQIEIERVLRKYPSRVLFGAGNMCRNYMKCYGETYPPLYTCDNNKGLWGEMFCGLEVKNPESLRDLDRDCAVIICNIYYKEIEAQLRQMNIKNPIEYFNDEHMPSFYFDRIKRDVWNGGQR